MNTGKFIVFEGIDGSGKSTQTRLLAEQLKQQGIPCFVTKEPGSPHVDFCKSIRALIGSYALRVSPLSELLLFMADRIEHLEKFVKPALETGTHVLCDRYEDSSFVYQTMEGKFSFSQILKIQDALGYRVLPDMTVFVDIPPEEAMRRTTDRAATSADTDTIAAWDAQALDFHTKLSQKYHRLYEAYKDNLAADIPEAAKFGRPFLIINGEQDPLIVHQDIWAQIKSLFV